MTKHITERRFTLLLLLYHKLGLAPYAGLASILHYFYYDTIYELFNHTINLYVLNKNK